MNKPTYTEWVNYLREQGVNAIDVPTREGVVLLIEPQSLRIAEEALAKRLSSMDGMSNEEIDREVEALMKKEGKL